MTRLLAFIATHMGYLWDGARYRITDSLVGTANGGSAVLFAESAAVRLRFSQERGQLFLELQATTTSRPKEWFSIDLVRRLYLGNRETSGPLDESYAAFLGEHLDDLEQRFAEPTWEQTRTELKRLALVRSKEMFG